MSQLKAKSEHDYFRPTLHKSQYTTGHMKTGVNDAQ